MSPAFITHEHVTIHVGPHTMELTEVSNAYAALTNVPDEVEVHRENFRYVPKILNSVFISTHERHTLSYKGKTFAVVQFPKVVYVPQPAPPPPLWYRGRPIHEIDDETRVFIVSEGEELHEPSGVVPYIDVSPGVRAYLVMRGHAYELQGKMITIS